MGKLIKYSLYTLLSLITVIVIAIILLITLVDPNRFKDPLQNNLSVLIARDIQINGDIDWRIYPWLGLTVQKLTVVNPPGFTTQDFAQIEKISLSVKLIPLIKGNINLGTISLSQPTIKLIINEQGNNNWESIGQAPNPSQPTNTDSPQPDSKSPFFNLSTMHIAEVRIKQAQLSLDDQQSGQMLQVEALKLNSKDIRFQQAFPLKLSFTFAASDNDIPVSAGVVSFAGHISLDQPVLFDTMQVNGQMRIKPLLIKRLNIDRLTGSINIDHKIITIKPIIADLYQGQANASAQIDLSQNTPHYKLSGKLKDIQAEPLLTDIIGTKRISGLAHATLDLTTKGNDTNTLTQALSGTVSFNFKDGLLEGISIPNLIDWATAVFKKQGPPRQNNTANSTAFGDITGTATINEGILNNRDFDFTSPYYHITGQGAIDLHDQKIDYRLQAEILDLADNKILSQMQKALGGNIPLIISGDLAALEVKPDLSAIAKASTTGLVQEQAKKLLNKDKLEDTGDKAKQLLKKLLPQ